MFACDLFISCEMQCNYVNMQDNYVNMRLNYVACQYTYLAYLAYGHK